MNAAIGDSDRHKASIAPSILDGIAGIPCPLLHTRTLNIDTLDSRSMIVP